MAKTPEIDLRENYGKNYLINGDMRIAQRGTSFPAAANDTFVADRWKYNKVGAAVHTLTQDTDVPTVAQSGYVFQNSIRLNLTTPDTSLAAGEFVSIRQQIEGYNWANLAQKVCTLSFWVKATLTGTYCVSLENFVDRSIVAEYTINSANTWEYKTIVIPASPSAGTWNYANGTGIAVRWTLGAGAGSTFIAPSAGSWQTGNYIATTSQVNGVNTGATDFRITGAMLNEGYEALPFRLFGGDIQSELAACQRYFEKSYDLGASVGSFPTLTGAHSWHGVGSSNRPFTTFYFKVRKRATPSTILYNPNTGGTGTPLYDSQGSGSYAVASSSNSETSYWLTPSGTPPANSSLFVHWAADAEL